MYAAGVDPHITRHKVFSATVIYVYKLLWVAVYQREPGALHLHHDTVAFFEYVGYIW